MGLDIGGANIKLADSRGEGVSRPFALWNNPAGLAAELAALLSPVERDRALAVTMTGELADCFADTSEGVRQIVASVVAAADGRQVRLYSTSGDWLRPGDLEGCDALVASVAAANWHALARFSARHGEGDFQLLVDIGSTTMDVIPISKGVPQGTGRTDTERLSSGELVYAGVRRTAVSSLVSELPLGGQPVPLARELFATTLDVYLVLGEIEEDGQGHDTADGRPATIEHAHARMARMLCASPHDLQEPGVVKMAETVAAKQRQLLGDAITKVLATAGRIPDAIVLSGEGSFLGEQVVGELGLEASLFTLDALLGPGLSRVAPALAVAVLAGEEVDA
ncbi:MAG: hydantoinase/oxoprolinase family protein [Pirellulaceae bacterium]|nr:hydantoinase/oxoprolinase family protein [Pirellulaceae bacterium]